MELTDAERRQMVLNKLNRIYSCIKITTAECPNEDIETKTFATVEMYVSAVDEHLGHKRFFGISRKNYGYTETVTGNRSDIDKFIRFTKTWMENNDYVVINSEIMPSDSASSEGYQTKNLGVIGFRNADVALSRIFISIKYPTAYEADVARMKSMLSKNDAIYKLVAGPFCGMKDSDGKKIQTGDENKCETLIDDSMLSSLSTRLSVFLPEKLEKKMMVFKQEVKEE